MSRAARNRHPVCQFSEPRLTTRVRCAACVVRPAFPVNGRSPGAIGKSWKSVAALHGESGITYRAALAFNQACHWVREILTPKGYSMHVGDSVDDAVRDEAGDRLPGGASSPRNERERGAK